MAHRPEAAGEAIPSPIPGASLCCDIESRVQFASGYADVRRYRWEHQVDADIRMPDDAVFLNMALTPRPAATRIARFDDSGAAPAEPAGRLLVMMPGSHFRLSAPTGQLRSMHCALYLNRIEELIGEPLDWQGQGGTLVLNGPNHEIEWLLNRLRDEFSHQRSGWKMALEAYGNALCVELARRLKTVIPTRDKPYQGGLAPWRMKLLRERVLGDGPAPTVTELAALCAMTVRHLSRAFKTETGTTLSQFIEETTMDRASRLLHTTDLSISAIAAELGFASATTFSQAFRRVTGLLPSAARKG